VRVRHRFPLTASFLGVLLIVLPVPCIGVSSLTAQLSVTPQGAPASAAQNSSGNLVTFEVAGTSGDFWVTGEVACSGAVTGCTVVENPRWMGSDWFVTFDVSYSTGDAGTGTITFTASGGGGFSNEGSYDVTVGASPPTVTPDAEPVTLSPLSGYVQRFQIRNNDPASGHTFSFSVVCTGAVSGCSTPSPVFLQGNATGLANVTYSVSGSSNATGTLTLVADDPATGPDNGSINVSVAPTGPAVERSICLTIAVGADAAYECGDLRLVHELPSVRTMNKSRAAVLLYNSQHAHPYPLLYADVTAPSPLPQTIRAIVRINGYTVAQRDMAGSMWGSVGQIRRVVIGFAADTLSTSLYNYQLEIQRLDPSVATLQLISGQLPIVNRRNSPFGPGWWLAGWEKLYFGQPTGHVIWVGGDGSVRRYERAGIVGVDTAYVATPLDRPDTLLHTNTNRWLRRLVEGNRVEFNSAGIHDTTRNRLGHKTAFRDSSGLLVRIEIPPSAAGLNYILGYAGVPTRLTSFSAPDTAVGSYRVTSLAWFADSVRITDPGGVPIVLGYETGGTNRVLWRRDRRATVTTFTYDAGSRVSSVSLAPGFGGATIARSFCDAAVRGLASCSPVLVLPDSAYTRLDGPRTDSADVMDFWSDRWGALSKIRDAYGQVTTVTRGDPRWPVLPTRVQKPGGLVQGAAYDPRGNLASTTDSTTTPTLNPTTRYEWNQQWDQLMSVTLPSGRITTFALNETNGNRTVMWNPHGITYFAYGSLGLITSVTDGMSSQTTFTYSTTGNIDTVRTQLGFKTSFTQDRLGRVRVVRAPIDSLFSVFQTDTTVYDALSRVTRKATYGPSINGYPASLVTLNSFYDAEGNLDSLRRTQSPDETSVGPLVTGWRYDLAGRRLVEISSDGQRDSTWYDPAGNIDSVRTRRAHKIRMRYDRMNRVIWREIPDVSYASRIQGIPTISGAPFPTTEDYPYCFNTCSPGYLVRGDTQVFKYSPAGKQIAADNRDALVRRTYYVNGAVSSETLYVRTWFGTDFTKHVYTTSYEYDADGRRSRVLYPLQLSRGSPHRVSYTYDAAGALATIDDQGGSSADFTFSYNGRSDVRRVDMIGSRFDTLAYDVDGRITEQVARLTGNRTFGTRLRYADQVSIGKETLFGVYAPPTSIFKRDGLGQLRFSSSWRVETYSDGPYLVDASHYTEEQFTTDPMGNIRRATRIIDVDTWIDGQYDVFNSWRTEERGTRGFAQQTGRLTTAADTLVGPPLKYSSTLYEYDESGNEAFTYQCSGTQPCGADTVKDRATFYSADGRVRGAEARKLIRDNGGAWNKWRMTFEEYRYDALGRRVGVWSESSCEIVMTYPCNLDHVRRTIWDDARELGEIQMPIVAMDSWENDTLPVNLALGHESYDANFRFGRVAYTYAGGLDRPVSITRLGLEDRPVGSSQTTTWAPQTLVPRWGWRGHADFGTFQDGELRTCRASGKCVTVQWRWIGLAFALGKTQIKNAVGTPYAWFGSLIEDKEDGTGMRYRRNRYIDPETGRFTQEDPVGLAGGVNLYGFAEGDPTTYEDPFGLDVIYIEFVGYSVNTGSGYLPFGHGAVVAVAPDGTTTYYEYGRYPDPTTGKPSTRGFVRQRPVPNLVMGKDGKPTAESLRHLYSYISTNYGKGIPVRATYIAGADHTKVRQYAEGLANDPTRPDYNFFTNNCFTFCRNALGAAGVRSLPPPWVLEK
jgi:RHS repeat-associated protein